MDQSQLQKGALLLQTAEHTSAVSLLQLVHHYCNELLVVQVNTRCLQGELLRTQPTALPLRKKSEQFSS